MANLIAPDDVKRGFEVLAGILALIPKRPDIPFLEGRNARREDEANRAEARLAIVRACNATQQHIDHGEGSGFTTSQLQELWLRSLEALRHENPDANAWVIAKAAYWASLNKDAFLQAGVPTLNEMYAIASDPALDTSEAERMREERLKQEEEEQKNAE